MRHTRSADWRKRSLALDANAPTRDAIEQALARIEQERKSALEQNRKGSLTDEELAEIMDDIAVRKREHDDDLARLNEPLAVEDIRNEALQFRVGPDSVPAWWEETHEPPEPGVIAPGDPKWEVVVAGLRDEVKGIAPDQDPDELSEWARRYVQHLAETLDLTLVIPPEGYQEAKASLDDPREL